MAECIEMVRGTRLLVGAEARELLEALDKLRAVVERHDFEPVVVSALAPLELFEGQIGDNRAFGLDGYLSGRREILLPEVTAVLREAYRNTWSKSWPKPLKLWYAQRCYRYDRPQRGRWREFWQFGVEVLGGEDPHLECLLDDCLRALSLSDYKWAHDVERGQSYYSQKGFEIWKNNLQLAGGGPYAEGQGWALGVDRVLLVRRECAPTDIR